MKHQAITLEIGEHTVYVKMSDDYDAEEATILADDVRSSAYELDEMRPQLPAHLADGDAADFAVEIGRRVRVTSFGGFTYFHATRDDHDSTYATLHLSKGGLDLSLV